MSTITRTILGARIQTELLLGLKHKPVPFTTLNEKFNVQAGVNTPDAAVPTLQYLAIGIGGHRTQVGAEGISYPEDNLFSPASGALYRHLPFIMREVGSDLTTTERARYAGRVLEQHNGKNYICYYLRLIDTALSEVVMSLNVPQGGSGSTPPVIVVEPFVPDSSNLNPTPPLVPANGAVTTDGSYLTTSVNLELSFEAAEVEELLNVGRILFDNERQVVISEFGMVAAKPMLVTSSTATGSVNYYEAVQATLIAHSMVYYAMMYLNRGFDHTLELGAIEPLTIGTVR